MTKPAWSGRSIPNSTTAYFVQIFTPSIEQHVCIIQHQEHDMLKFETKCNGYIMALTNLAVLDLEAVVVIESP